MFAQLVNDVAELYTKMVNMVSFMLCVYYHNNKNNNTQSDRDRAEHCRMRKWIQKCV